MQVKNTLLLYTMAVVVAFGSFVFGYALVCISMMAEIIEASHQMTTSEFDYQLSLITTLLPLGAFIGTFLMQPLCNEFGENKTMIYLDVFAILAISLQTYQVQFWNIYVGRFLLGIYVGIASGIVPTYLISISPPQISGIVGSFNQLLITIGIAVAYALGAVQSIGWRQYMFFPAIFCAIRLVVLLFFRFDTLERHYAKGETESLQRYLALFYEDGSVKTLVTLRSLSRQEKHSSNAGSTVGWIDYLTSGAPRKVVTIAIVLACANQLSGINAILFYAKQVFFHITNGDRGVAERYALYLGLLQVVVTFISGFLINRFGRRTLMLVGQSLVVGSLLSGYLFSILLEDSEIYITIVVFIHIIGFSLSLGPVSFLYIAEMMENLTLVVIVVWVLTLFVSMVSQIMIKTFGIGVVFLFYGAASLCCLVFLCRRMVESKGLSRQQLVRRIEKMDERMRLHEEEGTTAVI